MKLHPTAKILLICLVAFPLMVGLAAYLAGFFYLAFNKQNPFGAGFLTYYQYWWYRELLTEVQLKYLKLSLGAGVTVVFVLPFLIHFFASRQKKSLHGDARFASAKEIRESGLMSDKGIIVGKYGNRYLMLPGQRFVMLAAPTRSGKGVGVVIPNLLNFPDSVVVLDIKQENYDTTAGFRAQHGQEVYLFNPFAADRRTHRYNPLSYISNDPNFRVGDILSIGNALYPSEGKDGSGKDAFWNDQARNLFLGLVMFLCETPEIPRTIGEVLRQASGYGRPIQQYLPVMMKRRYDEGRPLSDICVDALNRFIDNAENTLTGILASFNAPLTIWANPIVDAATSADDFLLTEVRKKPMTIYIGITPDRLVDAGLLVNLLFSQLINLNLRELPQKNPALKYQCLLLMDEFVAMGKVAIVSKAVAYMAGYNLRLLPIIQSLSQLESVYGQHESRNFITNHALQILYTPREQKDANEYSEMLGYFTEKNASGGTSNPTGFAQGSPSRSKNISDQKRALMLPQELKEMGQDKEIIVLENCKPILAEKIHYYKDPVFMKRLLPAPAVPLLDLDQHAAMVSFSRSTNYIPPDPPPPADGAPPPDQAGAAPPSPFPPSSPPAWNAEPNAPFDASSNYPADNSDFAPWEQEAPYEEPQPRPLFAAWSTPNVVPVSFGTSPASSNTDDEFADPSADAIDGAVNLQKEGEQQAQDEQADSSNSQSSFPKDEPPVFSAWSTPHVVPVSFGQPKPSSAD